MTWRLCTLVLPETKYTHSSMDILKCEWNIIEYYVLTVTKVVAL